jgi:hypothetical protein
MFRTTAMRCRLAAPCLILPLLGAAAHAADQPVTRPTRDVDVLYRTTDAAGRTAEQRVRWDAAAGRERIDPPTPGLHVIFDTRTHLVDSIRDAERLVLEIASADPAEGAAYARRGSATVAGLGCTVWQPATPEGAPEMCFTDDGVLLRVAAGGRTVAEAVRVTYAPNDPADFTVPQDYRRVGPGQPAPKEAAP